MNVFQSHSPMYTNNEDLLFFGIVPPHGLIVVFKPFMGNLIIKLEMIT